MAISALAYISYLLGITVRFVPLISVYLCHPFRFKGCHFLRFDLCHSERSSYLTLLIKRRIDMANKLDPMDIRQILSLLNDGFSNRKVGSTLGVSRNTVNSYVNQLKASGHSVSEALCFDESRLMELFPDKSTIDSVRHNELMQSILRVLISLVITLASLINFIIMNMPIVQAILIAILSF